MDMDMGMGMAVWVWVWVVLYGTVYGGRWGTTISVSNFHYWVRIQLLQYRYFFQIELKYFLIKLFFFGIIILIVLVQLVY